jgi:hypothetical protein
MNLKLLLISSNPGINCYGGKDICLTQVTGLREMQSKIDKRSLSHHWSFSRCA